MPTRPPAWLPWAVALTDTVVELARAGAKKELLRKLYGLEIFA